MPRKKGPKYYAVRAGRCPGIYSSWEDCKLQVDGYSKPQFKSFFSKAEAESFLTDTQQVKVSSQTTAKKSTAQSGGENSKNIKTTDLDSLQSSTVVVDSSMTYRLEFDGGARDNASPNRQAGCGALIAEQDSDAVVGKIALRLGSYTNNQAEYAGLILGLEAAHCLGVRKIYAFGDSKLVINQVEGKWRVKEPGLQSLHARAVAAFKCFETITLEHVLRAFNKRADSLANLAMDGKGWTGIVDAQGEKLAEFDTRSILETADARAGAVIPSRQPATTPDGQSSLRKRAGSKRRRSSSPGATADGMG